MNAAPDVRPCCLTIAGSDSGGNAGVQADLRAFHAYGLHGCTVFAALTAQTPFAVRAVHGVPPDFVAAQLEAVLGAYSIAALKTGMLSDPAVVEVVARRLAQVPDVAKIVDPVIVSTSGARLVPDDALSALKSSLLPLARLVTPNFPEAEALLSLPPSPPREATVRRSEEYARALCGMFGAAVLVKGGHGADEEAVDVLFDGEAVQAFAAPRVRNPVSTHGTGCSLAAALTAELALGATLADAVRGAKDYVRKAISGSYFVGPGCGVLGFVDKRRRYV